MRYDAELERQQPVLKLLVDAQVANMDMYAVAKEQVSQEYRAAGKQVPGEPKKKTSAAEKTYEQRVMAVAKQMRLDIERQLHFSRLPDFRKAELIYNKGWPSTWGKKSLMPVGMAYSGLAPDTALALLELADTRTKLPIDFYDTLLRDVRTRLKATAELGA